MLGMDFLDPKKKRAQTIRLYIGYALMAVLIGISSLILLFAAFGYGVDKKGNVYQNGLVFVASNPGEAEVTLTNKQTNKSQKALTDERLILPAGSYGVEFLKQGYRPWQHDIELSGGGIERLTYPFLFPQDLTTSDVQTFAAQPKMSSSTPDRTRILVQPGGKFNGLQLYDAQDPAAAAQTIQIPSSIIPANSSATLSVIEWASNNRNVLLSYKTGGNTKFVVIDIENPSRSIDVNEQFDVNPKEVLLFDKRTARMYLRLSNNRLVLATVQNKATETIADDVLDFKPHGDDTVLYATTKNRSATNKVSVLIKQDDQAYKIRELPIAKTYLLDLARYNDHWNVAIGSSNDEHVYVYRDPVETLTSDNANRIMAIRTMKIKDPAFLSFSENAQFTVAQNGGNFVVYDALNNEQFSFEMKTPFDKPETKWMDGHRLVNSAGGKVVVFDFDGTNYQTLSSISPSAPVLFDQGRERLYSIAPSQSNAKEFALSLTSLRVN